MYTQLEQRGKDSPPVNVSTPRAMKERQGPNTCLTAYDACFARVVDAGGVDAVLAGQGAHVPGEEALFLLIQFPQRGPTFLVVRQA